MSWFARTLANSLSLSDTNNRNGETESSAISSYSSSPLPPQSAADSSPRGVKEDISEITKTLTRQFWGVASFLAPPPSSPATKESHSGEGSQAIDSLNPGDDSPFTTISDIRSDFEEIRGRFRSEISRLSNNKAVKEITKMASSLLSLGSGEEKGSVEEYTARGVLGLSEEVVDLVKDISMHPEAWLDFPLSDSDDYNGFDLSDVQQEHALAVESLVPSLAALRIELCPIYMTESCFWKIYFHILYPKFPSHQAPLLSTPQVLEAREDAPVLDSGFPETCSADPTTETSDPAETGNSPVRVGGPGGTHGRRSGQEPGDKEGLRQTPLAVDEGEEKEEDDGDEWLEEEDGLEPGTSRVPGGAGDEEDVSFSDLEADDD